MPSDPAPPEAASALAARTRYGPLVLLLLFAATFPEVLSGSTPVPELLAHPSGFLLLLGLYGGGAVLVWEALARWRKGWLAVVPWGLAYGIAEEGLATKTFTDPHQQFAITGIPGAYGNLGGVEWVTVAGIDPFHAAVSIGLELLLIALLFPRLKGRSIVSDRALAIVGLAFAATVTLMFFTVDPDPLGPLAVPLVGFALLGVGLIVAGCRLPDGALAGWMRAPTPAASPRAFFAVAFGWLLALLVLFQIGSHLLPWAGILILLFVASGALSLGFLLTRSGWRENRPHQVAFVGGFAGAFVVWDVLLEALGDVGVLAFTAVFVALVVWIQRHPEGLGARGDDPGR
ncbi:MAG TPA: hypothetical protein VMG14_03650 [Thermoplasmata archaeon]|nr:hypothetical protein [Thermoplasmata archaeon]